MSTPLYADAMSDPFLNVENSAKGRKWVRRDVIARDVETMVQQGHNSALAEVLSARGVTPDYAEEFLSARLRDHLPDPYIMQGMKQAAARLVAAITAGETIGVFGDYDVDGTTSSALLYRYFKSLGITCIVHLPDRQTEGYGPNITAFEGLIKDGASLILTVDCGATAVDCLTQAEQAGMDVIVLDHHLMEALPPAVAVVNPSRPDDISGLTGLSAGGVVFMTMVALNRALREADFFTDRAEPKLLGWLDLVALSLVCDVMPLKGLTRVLVRQGLKVLDNFDTPKAGNPGILGLGQDAGAKGVAQASHFGFSIGPRINAAGRIGHAKLAFDLLTEDNPERVKELSERLGMLNGARQGVEQTVLDQALALGEKQGGREGTTPLIVSQEGWHPGVIGIVAGRLKERFDRPTIVITFDGDEGKGSGRSLPGVDLGAAITAAVKAGVITGGGGHPMAAGVSLTRVQLPEFEQFLTDTLGESIASAQADQVFRLDGIASAACLTASFCDLIQGAGPFGNGNPEPRFALTQMRIGYTKVLKDKHISVTAQDKMGRTARCICFGCIGTPLGDMLLAAGAEGGAIHLAGRIKPDDWRGGDAGQFHIEDASWAGA